MNVSLVVEAPQTLNKSRNHVSPVYVAASTVFFQIIDFIVHLKEAPPVWHSSNDEGESVENIVRFAGVMPHFVVSPAVVADVEL